MKIGICAPSTSFTRDDANKVTALAQQHVPQAQLIWHDQCFIESGHFAGTDAQRCDAFCEMANDPAMDAVWFVRGGYGAARIAQAAIQRLGDAARTKTYMGYSDGGNMLGALYKSGIGHSVHGPMPGDIRRDGGTQAVKRALDWLVRRDVSALEPHIMPGQKYAAFNLMTLAMITGTPLMPDLSRHVLMIEEVSEHMYAFDRAMFNVMTHLQGAGLSGLRLGRVSDVPGNDRPFGEDAHEIAQRWCARTGIAYLGTADIGHDADNRVVPFGEY